MRYFVYIIQSKTTGQWYFGYSTELEKRLGGHNKGLNKSTRNRGPWEYIFIREFASRSEALSFELYLKKSRNKEYIQKKFSQYFLPNPGVYPDASGPVSAPR